MFMTTFMINDSSLHFVVAPSIKGESSRFRLFILSNIKVYMIINDSVVRIIFAFVF